MFTYNFHEVGKLDEVCLKSAWKKDFMAKIVNKCKVYYFTTILYVAIEVFVDYTKNGVKYYLHWLI